jgi:hypothetical protein
LDTGIAEEIFGVPESGHTWLLDNPKDNTASDLWLENQFLAVAGSLSELHRQAGKQAERISTKKFSTRMELCGRLRRGKDYMDSFFGARARLEQVADACLSPYYFLRVFREVSAVFCRHFGVFPREAREPFCASGSEVGERVIHRGLALLSIAITRTDQRRLPMKSGTLVLESLCRACP